MSAGQRGICDSTKQKPTPKRVLQWTHNRGTTYECRHRIVSKRYAATVQDSAAFASTTSGESASSGLTKTPWRSKSAIVTEGDDEITTAHRRDCGVTETAVRQLRLRLSVTPSDLAASTLEELGPLIEKSPHMGAWVARNAFETFEGCFTSGYQLIRFSWYCVKTV